MCGIVYSKSFTGKGVVPTIVQRYMAQKHRGSSGFGFYIPEKNRLTHNTKEGRILSLLKREENESEVLWHHRFPTSTANVRTGCHPYSTKDVFENNYVVVHNGVLRNEAELKKKHEELGINYVSVQENGRFNDSEALAYDIARFLEGEKDKIEAKGSIAFIAIKRDKAGKPMTLFFGRNSGNPLKMKKTKYSLTLSSEGEGEMIDTNTLYSMSYDTLQITKRTCIIETGYSTYYGGRSQYQVPTRNTNACYPYDDDDDELSTIRNSWDKNNTWDDDDDYEYMQSENSEVKDVVQSLLYEVDYDTALAIGLAESKISTLQARQMSLDFRSQDEEQEDTITEVDINEYCGNEDKIRYLEEAVKQLRADLVKEVVKEGKGRQPMGFHPHTAPEVKQLGTGLPYAD